MMLGGASVLDFVLNLCCHHFALGLDGSKGHKRKIIESDDDLEMNINTNHPLKWVKLI